MVEVVDPEGGGRAAVLQVGDERRRVSLGHGVAVLVADRAQPAGGAAFAAGLGAGAWSAGSRRWGRTGDPDAAQQMQGRLGLWVGRVG